MREGDGKGPDQENKINQALFSREGIRCVLFCRHIHSNITKSPINIGFDVFYGLCYTVFFKGERVASIVFQLLEPEVSKICGNVSELFT